MFQQHFIYIREISISTRKCNDTILWFFFRHFNMQKPSLANRPYRNSSLHAQGPQAVIQWPLTHFTTTLQSARCAKETAHVAQQAQAPAAFSTAVPLPRWHTWPALASLQKQTEFPIWGSDLIHVPWQLTFCSPLGSLSLLAASRAWRSGDLHWELLTCQEHENTRLAHVQSLLWPKANTCEDRSIFLRKNKTEGFPVVKGSSPEGLRQPTPVRV